MKGYELKKGSMLRIAKSCISVTSAAAIVLLSGCAAVETAVEHRHLEINSKMSSTVFLDPVAPKDKTIFVQVHNTSSQRDIDLADKIVQNLKENGWTITHDFSKANDRLQVNILQVGKVKNKQDMYATLSNGFGGGLAGGLAGAAIGGGTGAVVGGAAGAAAGWVAGMLVKDVTYSMITDIQLSQKAPDGAVVSNETQSNIAQGSSTQTHQSYHSSGRYMTYRTRILSYADQVNLDFKKVKAPLSAQMAKEISSIF